MMIRGDAFPAFYRTENQALTGESIQEQGRAECYNHPGKQAIVPCSICGRLLCSLCEISLDGKSLCMHCLQSGKKKKKISSLENKRFLYDSLALSLSLWPLLFVFPTIITAPAAIFVVLRYWKAPGSIVPRSKVRYVLAFLIASCQILIWVLLFAGVLNL